MAQYKETVYASDSWAENYVNGDLSGVTRAAVLSSQENFSFTYENMPYFLYAASESWIRVRYPTTSQYQKKRLVRAQQYVYVTGTSSSSSGNIKSGRFVFGYGDFISDLFDVGAIDSQLAELGDLPKNQYAPIGDLSRGNGELSTGVSKGYLGMTPNVWAGCTGSLYTGNRYTAKASMSIQSHTGANRPYVVLTYEDVTPRADQCTPKSGFVHEKAENIFRWRFWANQTAVAQPVQQAGYQFRWRQTGQSVYQESTVTSGEPSYTVPAGTFPENGSIDWCVRVQSDDGIWSEWSDWMTLTTQDSVSRTVLTYPVEAYLDGSKDNVFQWKHVISTGTPQSRYDLQYSSDSGQSWLDLDSAQTAQTSTIIPADTFPAGQLLWKARTYNSDGVPGDWSEPAAIIVRAAPPEPVLTIGEVRPRPLFQWQATGQASWCLTVYQDGEEIYTTGEMPGEEKSFRITKYLANGIYEAALWVKNLYELQSPTAKVSFTLEAQTPPPPYLTVQAAENKAVLTISGAGFYRYYIFRDDVLVYKMDAPGVWEDFTACGAHTYWVRGVTKNDAFSDSNRVRASILIEYAQLVDLQDLKHPILLKCRRGEYPVLEGSVKPEGESVFYAGRKYPLFEFSEHLSEPLSMTFSYRKKSDFFKLVQIMQNSLPVLYRDYRGERCYLALTGLDYTTDPVSWDFTISATRVDYVEEIEYDPPEVVSE